MDEFMKSVLGPNGVLFLTCTGLFILLKRLDKDIAKLKVDHEKCQEENKKLSIEVGELRGQVKILDGLKRQEYVTNNKYVPPFDIH